MSKRLRIAAFVALPVLAAGWYLFRPETAFIDRTVREAAVEGAMTLAKGEFSSDAHETRGTAEVIEKDGQRYVRLSGFETSNGPDVRITLVKGDATDSDGIKKAGWLDLGALKGNVGDQNYMLPANVDLAEFGAVSVWCRRFGVNFGAAAL